MDYISVKEAASKFNLSERRIQKLCETNRIAGCQMLGGVWLIPASATKPSDERITEILSDNDHVSLKELCEELSISTATGRNWIKLGKLMPEYTTNKTPYFTNNYATNLKNEIKSGENTALKSRRNKTYISGKVLYKSYVSENCKNLPVLQKMFSIVSNKDMNFDSENIQYIIADCALQLYADKMQLSVDTQKPLLEEYLNKKINLTNYGILIDDLIDSKSAALEFCKNNRALFSLKYTYEHSEDILGLIYISCINIRCRKATGSYYTPTKVVKKLISNLNIKKSDKILDPCCGTGNFLLQLPQNVAWNNIYGNDIDPVSVKITRLNMALKYSDASIETICQHITKSNYLTEYNKSGFNYIIGNPPWGYNFSETEKTQLRRTHTAISKKNVESYDIFIEHALSNLAEDGQLSYVVPEAILNVKAHTDIRNIILQKTSIKYLEFLGNAFDQVHCPCIILQLSRTKAPFSTMGMKVRKEEDAFEIKTERTVSPKYFSFITTDSEYEILNKIKENNNISFLADNADFALGIVTGNNKAYISSQKAPGNEIVLKGANICKYHIKPGNNFINFMPEHFQQTAPTEIYRAPEKLLYRFICNELVFAYDDKQTLSLNSCNIIIPKLDGVNIKFILAILNSRIAQFIYKKQFNSIKVLRSHIENIPIPIVNRQTQNKIIAITDLLIQGQNIRKATMLYNKLDSMICQLFDFTQNEQKIIQKAVGENKFLV